MQPFFSVRGHGQGKRCPARFGGICKRPATRRGQHPTPVCSSLHLRNVLYRHGEWISRLWSILPLVIHVLGFQSRLFMHIFCEVSHFTESQPGQQINILHQNWVWHSEGPSRRSFQNLFLSMHQEDSYYPMWIASHLLWCREDTWAVSKSRPCWHVRCWHCCSLSEDVSLGLLLREREKW